MTQQMYISLHM